MMYFIELIRYVPGRAEPEVLGRINYADRDPEGARAKAKSVFLQTKVAGMDQGLATGLGQAAFLTWSYGLASISRWRGAFSDLRDHSPTLYLRRRGHVAATRLERCCGGRWSISLRRGQPVTTQGDIAAPTPGDELSNGHGCSYLLLLPRSGNLIDPIDLAEFLQKLRVAVVQTHDPAELRAVAPFVLDDLAPDLDHAE